MILDNVSLSNLFLIPSDSVTAALMGKLEKMAWKAGAWEQEFTLCNRIRVVVYHYLVVPAAALILFPVTACKDLIGRTIHVLFNCFDGYDKIYVVGLISLVIILPLRIMAYLVGARDSLFPIDWGAKEKLEEGIDVSLSTLAIIQQLMPKILEIEPDDELIWHTYGGRGRNRVFSLKSVPNLVFKMAPSAEELRQAYREMRNRQKGLDCTPIRVQLPQSNSLRGGLNQQNELVIPRFYTDSDLVLNLQGKRRVFPSSAELSERRFQAMIKAKEICLKHQLNHLVVPHAKKFSVGGETLIVEERMNISSLPTTQKELYRTLPCLDKAIQELAKLILKIGFNDVEWRNVPIVNEEPQFQGARRIALVDLEHTKSAAGGIFGDSSTGSRGLINCLFSEAQIDAVIDEARREGVVKGEDKIPAETFKARRMEKILRYQRLDQFYRERGILENPSQPIILNINKSKELVHEDFLLKQSAMQVLIDLFNKEIQKETSADLSTKSRRKIKIKFDKSRKELIQGIMDDLVEQGYLFSWKQKAAEVWVIQA